MALEKLHQTITDLGITMTTEFVPWSKSRHAKPKPKLHEYNLNWRVTILHNGKAILTTDYSQGVAHCPSYKKMERSNLQVDAEVVIWECENGRRGFAMPGGQAMPGGHIIGSTLNKDRGKLEPKIDEVLYALVSETDVLDYASYEEWGPELGYSADSREGEKVYNAVMKNALAMRAGLGEDGLKRLREAGQDYED